jgi:hypothetical protein
VPGRASGLPRRGAAATDTAAPGMVEAILDGRQPEGVTLPELLEGVLVQWGKQTRVTVCLPTLYRVIPLPIRSNRNRC